MKRIFLIGHPVSHSISPAMQNAALGAQGLAWRYEILDTPLAQLPAVAQRLRRDDCVGANVTIPHKEAIIEFLDDVTATARQIGAVNTIIKRDGKLIGDNTDCYGVAQTLCDAQVELRGARIVVLGAGGAARAAVFAFAAGGAVSIGIVNRTASRAAALADELHAHFPRLALTVNQHEMLECAELVVNATSVGMLPQLDESPMPPGTEFRRGTVSFDLVYRPLHTRFLRDAARAGARPVGGLGMLTYQGAAAFTLWTGCAAPIEVMSHRARLALES